MQKVLAALGSRQRPVLFLSPFVSSHDEDLDRLLFREIILHAFEEILIPIQRDFILVELGRSRTEVDIANLLPAAGMAADDHQQALCGACPFSSVCSNSRVVAQGPSLKNV